MQNSSIPENIIKIQENFVNEIAEKELNSITLRTEIEKLSKLKNYLNTLKEKEKKLIKGESSVSRRRI